MINDGDNLFKNTHQDGSFCKIGRQSKNQRAVLVSDNVLRSNPDFVVTSKPKRGRPRKSGRALEGADVVVEAVTEISTKKKMKVKCLVHFQPR